MLIKINFLSFVLLFRISACSQDNKQSIFGVYGNCSDKLSCSQIELKPDSTFIFGVFFDIGGRWNNRTGKFTLRDDTLILNGFDRPSFEINSISEHLNPTRNDILISIYLNEMPVSNAEVSINGKVFKHIEYESLETEKQAVSTLKIRVNGWVDCGLKDSLFYIKNSVANEFVIHLKPNNFYLSKYLIDEKWLLKGDKIYYWRKRDGSFDHTSFLKKVSKDKKRIQSK